MLAVRIGQLTAKVFHLLDLQPCRPLPWTLTTYSLPVSPAHSHALTCSRVRAVETFAAGLQQDEAAIKAALTLPWSSGQAEGQINKLKLIKRQMYGRANFDLIRRRVLLAA
jgi:transposase